MIAPNHCLSVLAAPAPLPPRGWEYPIFWASLPLIGVLLLGAFVLYLVDRYRKRTPRRGSLASDQLAHFRSMYERGELSREEFETVRTRLTAQMRKELDVGGPMPGSSPSSPRTDPPPPSPGGNGEAGNRLA